MAEFEVKVYKLRIEEHPNADVLELAVIGDYRSIVRKGEFKTGDLGVYIPEAAVVPDWLIERLGLTGRLAGKQRNRVKAVKLRGILSQGLIVPVECWNPKLTVVGSDGDVSDETIYVLPSETDGEGILVKEGQDVTEFLGITKYEPVIPTSMNGEVFNAFGMTLKFDIENIKKYPDIFEDGEEVTFTEKLHGTWCCFGFHPDADHPIVTSKGLSDKGLAFKFNEANENNLYVKMFHSLNDEDGNNLLDRFMYGRATGYFYQYMSTNMGPVYFLGEIFGTGVQDLTYGNIPKSFRVFDIYMDAPGNGHYVNSDEVVEICSLIGLKTVPTLYKGPFSKEILEEHTNGKETVSGAESHIREGVVIRPVEERRDDEIGRVILKSISEKYLLRKNATEYT